MHRNFFINENNFLGDLLYKILKIIYSSFFLYKMLCCLTFGVLTRRLFICMFGKSFKIFFINVRYCLEKISQEEEEKT